MLRWSVHLARGEGHSLILSSLLLCACVYDILFFCVACLRPFHCCWAEVELVSESEREGECSCCVCCLSSHEVVIPLGE